MNRKRWRRLQRKNRPLARLREAMQQALIKTLGYKTGRMAMGRDA
jgi:hypothetical protein